MNNIPIRRKVITIPAGGVIVTDAAGDFLFVESVDQTNVTARLERAQGGVVADDIPIKTSAKYSRLPQIFDRVIVRGAAGAEVIIWTGEGDVSLNIAAEAVDSTRANQLHPLDDLVIANLDTDRPLDGLNITDMHYVILEADEGNAGPVRVGGVGVDATSGIKLQPGQTVKLDGNELMIVEVYNGTGAAATVRGIVAHVGA
jgi:hypothetical protein